MIEKINLLKEDSLNVLGRFWRRDFSGNSGDVLKNSIIQLIFSLILKVGALLFTIIIARILLPETFGLYTLALGTITLFSAFSDLGIGSILINVVAKAHEKKSKKENAYYVFLLRTKLVISLICIFILAISAYFLANHYYQKPIFLALLAGSFYILITGLVNFYTQLNQAVNRFKPGLYKEIIFQILRLIFIPLVIISVIHLADEIVIFSIIFGLSICYLVPLVYLIKVSPKLRRGKKLERKDKSKLISLILPLSSTIVSGAFLGYVDMVILGRFVSSLSIGYYASALSLVGAMAAIVGFLGGVLLPLFSKLSTNSSKLDLVFHRILNVIATFGILGIIAVQIAPGLIILVTYGPPFLPAIVFLRFFSILLIIDTITAVYTSYFIAKEKQKTLFKSLVISTALNIILSLSLVSYLIQFSEIYACLGAVFAMLISRALNLFILYLSRKN